MDRREALERILQQRPSQPLREGDHLLLSHAVRCRCQGCNSILDWSDADAQGIFRAQCCKREYALRPWTVKVSVASSA